MVLDPKSVLWEVSRISGHKPYYADKGQLRKSQTVCKGKCYNILSVKPI